MNNVKESVLLAIIAANQPYFAWDSGAETVTATVVMAIVWWCLLTWKDEVKERFKPDFRAEK